MVFLEDIRNLIGCSLRSASFEYWDIFQKLWIYQWLQSIIGSMCLIRASSCKEAEHPLSFWVCSWGVTKATYWYICTQASLFRMLFIRTLLYSFIIHENILYNTNTSIVASELLFKHWSSENSYPWSLASVQDFAGSYHGCKSLLCSQVTSEVMTSINLTNVRSSAGAAVK